MITKLDYKGHLITIADEGKGIPVVFVHGYLESMEIWKPFSDGFKDMFRVIRIDIPGHGKSGILNEVHTMDLMAEVIRFVLDVLFIDRCVLTGHSLGGYIALAFADHYPERLLGFCLFHSHPFADNEEKKQNRDREIELVRSGKKDLVCNTNIPKHFAGQNLDRLKAEVERAKKIAAKTPEKGIIAILEGMKERPDRQKVISNTEVPLLWILGKKDNLISLDTISAKVTLNDKGKLFILGNSGHMGFIEEPKVSMEKLRSFIQLCGS